MVDWDALLLTTAALLGVLGALTGAARIGFALADRWKRRRRRRRIARLLAGRRLADVLVAAPYEFDHWQGEDGYRIVERGSDGRPVAWAATEGSAVLWILEHTDPDVGASSPAAGQLGGPET